MKTQICILANALMQIGGIETFVYNWCLLMKDTYNIVVAYSIIDNEQLFRLQRIVKTVPNTTPIECDTLMVMHIGTKTIPDNIKYDTKIQMVHGCLSAGYGDIPQCDLLIPVSNTAMESYGAKIAGYNTEVIHNVMQVKKPRKILKLISATRLTSEKGGSRIMKLAKMLREANIPFVWYVFSNRDLKKPIKNKYEFDGIIEMPPTLDISDWIKECDYLVQLSDTESFGYSIVESLMLGTPVIVTPLEVLEEIGVKDGVNGFVVPFSMRDIDLQKIYESELKFDYKYNNNLIYKQWCDVLGEPKPFTPYEEEFMKIKVIREFKNKDTGKKVPVGSIFECDDKRALNIVSLKYGELIEEPKKKEKEIVVEEVKDEDIPFVPETPIEEESEEVVKKEVKKTTKKTTKSKGKK